jgi:hypothetical protein
MPQAFYILFGAGYTVVVATALGRMLLRRLRAPLHRQEEHPLAFLTGAALLSLIVFGMAAARIVYKGTFIALGILVLAAAWRTGAHRATGQPLAPLPKFWRALCWAVFTLFGVLAFSHAMAPEMSPDGSAYHLGLVGRYYRERGFHRITTNMYANLSQGVEMLFLYAFAFGRHSAAALVHFSFLVALGWSMLNFVRRFGLAPSATAGALLVFASPVVGIDAASAYNDVAVAAILFGVFALVEIWATTRARGLILAIGLLAGFAYAAKYTAFLAVPYALARLVWKRASLGQLATFAAAAGLLTAPWAAKNWIWIENPVSPFFNRLFPNPNVRVSFEQEYREHMRRYEMKDRRQIPLEVTVRGAILCGLTGPIFLLSPIALVALRDPMGRRLLLAALVFGLPYATNIGTRFLIPALPFLSMAMGLALANARGMAALLVAAHALSSWPDILKNYADPNAWRLDRIRYRQALRLESEDAYLAPRWPPYATARMIEELVPPRGRVLTFNQTGEAYTSREILVVYQSASNGVLGEILWTPLIPEYQPVRRITFRFAARPLRKARVVQTAEEKPDHWNISEIRVFHEGRELDRAARWRLTARPNPWDVRLAFDNSPVTRWKCWHPLYRGMYVEVDFGARQEIDSVVLECSEDQYQVRMRLEGSDGGAWTTLAEGPEIAKVPPPLGVKRMAALELKERGVTHLLVHENDFGAADYRSHADAWGITEIGERHGFRLYRID